MEATESDPPLEVAAASKEADIEFIDDNLFQLTLSRENKAEILEYAILKLEKSQNEADLILRNLKIWCPDVAALFLKRSYSTVLDTPFRLVYPKDALSAFDNGLYVRQYMAISYCWHSGDFPSPDYATHGHWPVSKPFVDAILIKATCIPPRIWILRPVKIPGDESDNVKKWRIVAKAILLGEPDLMREARTNGHKHDAAITLRERSIVVG